MDTKSKIVKLANGSYVACKVLYIAAAVACLVFTVLAVVLPLVVDASEVPPMEICSVMIDGALEAFFAIGVLWNAEQLFRSIRNEQSPFTEKLPTYLLKMGIITILGAVVPSTVATTVAQLTIPGNELNFAFSVGGVLFGVVSILMSVFFRYAYELQQKDDETL